MKYLRGLGFMAATLLIYLGLSLLGWGLGDLPGFFAHPGRLAYAVAVGIFAALVGYQAVDAPEGIEGSAGQKEKVVVRQTLIGRGLVGGLFLCLVFIPYTDRHGLLTMPDWPALRWGGVPFAAAGYALIFLSGLFLGRQYSAEVTLQAGHRLITAGPYRYVRHPRYLGILLIALGMALVFRSWIGLGLLAPIFGLLWFRIRDEEALMRREFGREWEAYCARTWRLLPYLW